MHISVLKNELAIVGNAVGFNVGVVGVIVGTAVGLRVGGVDGLYVGTSLGETEGKPVAESGTVAAVTAKSCVEPDKRVKDTGTTFATPASTA